MFQHDANGVFAPLDQAQTPYYTLLERLSALDEEDLEKVSAFEKA